MESNLKQPVFVFVLRLQWLMEFTNIPDQFEEEEKEPLTLLVVQLSQGTTFLLSSRLDSAVKRCSSEVLFSSGAAW